jgi:hypothetical protein
LLRIFDKQTGETDLTTKPTPSCNITYGQEKNFESSIIGLQTKVKQAGCKLLGQKQTIKI